MRLQQLLSIADWYPPGDVRRALVQALGGERSCSPARYADFYVAVYTQLRLSAHRLAAPSGRPDPTGTPCSSRVSEKMNPEVAKTAKIHRGFLRKLSG